VPELGVDRRTFFKGAGLAALSLAGTLRAKDIFAQFRVPNSAGDEAPRLKAPPNACDCHHHLYDAARFPPVRTAGLQPNARLEEYHLLQGRIGTTRNVIVTPQAYIGDNRITVDALAKLGANARGVALLLPEVTDAELKSLTEAGICGLRFSQGNPASASTTFDMIEPLSKRVAAFGWHVQIFMEADQIASAEALWNRFPTTLVFDHLGHLPQPAGVNHPAFGVLRRLLDKGRTWVKLSGAYIDTKVGPPGYADTTTVAQAFVKATPERLVWGSDWPHPSLDAAAKPDDAILFDLLSEWVPNEATRNRILVENPELLYGFAKSR
jgi:predicted TIM-barrel fold metal-dependent hydrolase